MDNNSTSYNTQMLLSKLAQWNVFLNEKESSVALEKRKMSANAARSVAAGNIANNTPLNSVRQTLTKKEGRATQSHDEQKGNPSELKNANQSNTNDVQPPREQPVAQKVAKDLAENSTPSNNMLIQENDGNIDENDISENSTLYQQDYEEPHHSELIETRQQIESNLSLEDTTDGINIFDDNDSVLDDVTGDEEDYDDEPDGFRDLFED